MRILLKCFLVVVAVSFWGDVASAQQVIGSVADIPVPSAGEAAAFFEPATGDVHFAIGEDLVLFGVDQAPFGFVDGVFDPNAVNPNTPLGVPIANNENEIAYFAALEDANGLSVGDPGFDPDTFDFIPFPSGVFNIGSLLPADPSIQTFADFDALYPDARFSFAVPGLGIRSPLNVVTEEVSFGLISAPTSSIPEPGSLSLLLLAGLGATVRRTRKNLAA